MSSTLLYGPDGNPLVTSSTRVIEGTATDVIKRLDHDVLEEQVAKRVRSQGTTLMSVWDRERGKPKPTPVDWNTLRLMGNRNEWVRAIVKTRKNQIGLTEWDIVAKDDDDKTPATERMCEAVRKLFSRPSFRGSRPHSRSWRHFLGELLEDLLILDAGAIEKERTLDGWIAAMYPVDGATIRPNIDEQGGFYEDAYVQVVDGIVTARFGLEDLVYLMDNPQTDVRLAGYGMSPLENLITSVTADLYAAKYNAEYFQKGAVPEGLLSLGEDCPPEDVDAFRLYWMNEIMGRPWALPIVAGKGVEWVQWRDSNRDMQFMEYQSWLLKKLCAVYQIAPQDIGELEDVNRSTADDQSDVSESKSTQPILSLIKDYIDVEVIGEQGLGLGDYIEFNWKSEDESAEQINAKFQPLVEAGSATRAEWRDAHGLDAADDKTPGAEGLDMYLSSGQLQPLPSSDDIEHLGAAAQQDQEAQQRQDELAQGGQPAQTPWQRGDANDPATQQAMDDHDEEHGIGPRNQITKAAASVAAVAKVAPRGRDRHPALTGAAADLEAVWPEQRRKLIDGLAGILHLPVDAVEQAADHAD